MVRAGQLSLLLGAAVVGAAASPLDLLLLGALSLLLVSVGLASTVAEPSPPLDFDAPSFGACLAPLLRKSVTYQPEPFSWKPAAETRLRSSALWQAGQSRSGASESFCSASSSCPQAAQRYS